ncbi:hypothetical protein EMIT0215P_60253 [Pseudomonas serboccidentalis]
MHAGANLLAKASVQPTSMAPDPPLSRAGSLLQWFCDKPPVPIHTEIPCRSELAREGVGPSNINPLASPNPTHKKGDFRPLVALPDLPLTHQ